jgi:acetyl esterase
VNRRTRLIVAAAKRLPHPEPPTDRYLARLRREPMPAALARALIGPVPRGVQVQNITLPHPVGLRARTYRPTPAAGPLAMVVNFHGGGFVIGNLATTDWLCGQVAARAGVLVVSVSYRLAPEHPAPVPFDDALAATRELLKQAGELDVDPKRVAVMGASAGGNLAALVALAERDRVRSGDPGPPLAAQILIYPATDLTLSSASVDELADAPLLTRSILDWYGRRYFAEHATEVIAPDDPRVSPLFAPDHRGLAPALVLAAGQDPLRDDAVRYAEVLAAAGVRVSLQVYPEAIHGFVSMPRFDPAAKQAVDDIARFLRASL